MSCGANIDLILARACQVLARRNVSRSSSVILRWRWTSMDVLESKLAREAVRPRERFGGEPGQTLDMVRAPLREERSQHGIGKSLRVEDLLESVQRLVASGVLVETRRRSILVLALSGHFRSKPVQR